MLTIQAARAIAPHGRECHQIDRVHQVLSPEFA